MPFTNARWDHMTSEQAKYGDTFLEYDARSGAAMSKQAIGLVQLTGARCRCGHQWLPRDPNDKPRVCPKCKSPNWDRAKKVKAT